VCDSEKLERLVVKICKGRTGAQKRVFSFSFSDRKRKARRERKSHRAAIGTGEDGSFAENRAPIIPEGLGQVYREVESAGLGKGY
jgi:hypothetical protein